MKKTFFLSVLVFALSFSFNSIAGSGQINGVWGLSRDLHLDGKLDADAKRHQVECNSHHNKFTCHYTGKNLSNDSIFTGEINAARTTKVISFYQYDATYYTTHSGREAGPNRFVGTWYDVAGNAGDFELTK